MFDSRVHTVGWAIVVGVLFGTASPTFADIYAPGTPLPSDYVLGPTVPGKWGDPTMGTGATVSYSFMPAGVVLDDGAVNDAVWWDPIRYTVEQVQAEIRRAFDAWSAVADITFVEVLDSGLPFNDPAATDGDIRIGGHVMDGTFGTLAHGFFPPENGSTAAGDLHFDSQDTWAIGFDEPGFDIFQVAAHEIGHAIGLSHEEVEVALMNPFYTEAFAGPQADDAEGAQALYGAPLAVPEPSSLVLTGVLAVGFLGHRLRRRQAA